MRRVLGAVTMSMIAVVVTACGSGGTPADPETSSTVATTAFSTPELTPLPTTSGPAVRSTPPPVVLSTEPASIVGCQPGDNPVETTRSDGSVTAYSEYCQNVRDEFVRGQYAAEFGPTEFTCESGYACGITEADGVVCDQNGCRSSRTG